MVDIYDFKMSIVSGMNGVARYHEKGLLNSGSLD